MDYPRHGQPPSRWTQLHLFDPCPPEAEPMTVRIPKWFLPIVGSFALGMVSWMTHLTLAVSEVQQAQARGEYLFESHDELRDDVRQQTKEISEIHRILARIDARLK